MPALVALLVLLASNAHAAEPTPAEATVDAASRAEYVRLQQEMEKLAARNAWAGVESTYQKILATGVAPAFEDHLGAAHAARALGDVGAARDRLTAANAIKEGEREILEWLWDIDSNYGRAYFACDLTKNHPELTAAAMPFNPDQRRSVEFAIAKVTETCLFDGLLPHGQYVFGDNEVKVHKVQNVRLDLRGMEVAPVKKEKKKKGEEPEAAAAPDPAAP